MPATENNRRNMQEPTLANPSLPDHDRTRDKGMHSAVPREMLDPNETMVGGIQEGQANQAGSLDERPIAAPDQEFGQLLKSGPNANSGRIPEDPNNWLTSDPEQGYGEGDPESRGDSLPDILDGGRH